MRGGIPGEPCAGRDRASPGRLWLKRDDYSSNRHPALAYWWSMIFPENRYPPRVREGMLFGIVL